VALVVLVYALGLGMAAAGGPPVAGRVDVLAAESLRAALLGGAALVPVTVAVHYANEYADVETDRLTDPTPFSGGSGALVVTGLSRSFLRSATALTVVVALLAIAGAALGGLPVDAVALLALGLLGGLAYSLPPVAFVRRGVGEPVNATLGAVVLPLYGVSVVGTPTLAAAVVLLPFALVTGCNLLATHWPDRRADAAVGKRTLVVRWSPTGVRRAYAALAVAAALVVAVLALRGVLPMAVALAHLGAAPFLLWGGLTLTRQRSPLPAVLAMVVLVAATTAAWWWVGPLGGL
jgi:1,4-dihydroxy-2-naphthoate octaprenyltransferase